MSGDNVITTLLKSRVAQVTLLFGVFGGALGKLLKIDEMEGYYMGLTSLVALVISLLISFLLKGRWSLKTKRTLQVVLAVASVLFIAAALFHTYVFLNKTYPYRTPGGQSAVYLVKGEKLSLEGMALKKKYVNQTENEILFYHLGGPNQKAHLWEQAEINTNTFLLIASYVLLVVFFSATTFALLEILAIKYGGSKKEETGKAGAKIRTVKKGKKVQKKE